MTDAKRPLLPQKDSADVVVIGSGAGGAPVAAILAEAGANVVVLERGPYYTSKDFIHDEVRMCRRNFWYPFVSDDPHTIRKSANDREKRTADGWTSHCVGGGTVHMAGFFYWLNTCDFQLKTFTGGIENSTIVDWPITLEDLIPYYYLMEARIGVSGRAGRNPFEARQRPYPLPPIKPNPSAQLFDQSATKMGYHPYPTPRAITSRVFGTRPPCNQCGLCGDYGCENNSKSSTLVTFIADAEATGRCQVRPHCMVRRILTDKADKAAGVEYVDARGTVRRIEARVVCLAASAVESARLLLLSENNRFPNGLANRNGLVGKNLTFSGFGKGTARFKRSDIIARIGERDLGLPFFQRSLQDLYWDDTGGLPLPKGGTYNFILHHPNPINAAVRLTKDRNYQLFGAAFKKEMTRFFKEELCVEFELFSESLPWNGMYVDLDPRIRDPFGLQVARITAMNHPQADAVNKTMVSRGIEMLKAMEPAARHVYPLTWQGTTFHLQQGTCRFGVDSASSVLDPSCRAHEVKNLYVTDASFMPTSGGAPSTATIMANALRVACIIRERFAKREI